MVAHMSLAEELSVLCVRTSERCAERAPSLTPDTAVCMLKAGAAPRFFLLTLTQNSSPRQRDHSEIFWGSPVT